MNLDPQTLAGGAVLVAAVGGGLLLLRQLMRPAYPPCPRCGRSRRVVEIFYGEPDRRKLRQAKRRVISLGGFRRHTDAPDLHCLACDFQWYSPAPPVIRRPD